MRYTAIIEGATLVHNADIKSRKALHRVFETFMEKIWKTFNPGGYNEEDPEEHHRDYQRMYDHFREPEHADWLFNELCEVATKTLTEVLHQDLSNRYGWSIPFKGSKVAVTTMRVLVSEKESDGKKSKWGGYFSGGRDWSYIRIYVKRQDILTAAMANAQYVAFGEAEDRDELVDQVAPIFAHEYSHLLQYLGAGGHEAFEPGITTIGGGKRGGRYLGGENPSMIDWARYRGSMAELDSFASQAASEIIASALRYRHSGIENGDIENKLTDISTGYATNSQTYRTYIDFYQDSLADVYQDIGLSKDEARKVWQRFLKLLHAKIAAYKKPTHGKDKSGYHTTKGKPEWLEWAKKGLTYCVTRMADDVARDCADKSYNFGDDWRIEPYSILERAQSFIEGYFFEESFEWERSRKIIEAFKKLVVTRLENFRKAEAA